jgi:transcriptional regulator with XRE-family HTH domain
MLKTNRKDLDAKTALKLNITELRKKFQMSQTDLADKAGTYQKVISQIESGKTWPEYNTIQGIAKALGVEESDLFTDPEMLRSLKYLMGRK